jgi:hypothetical protein
VLSSAAANAVRGRVSQIFSTTFSQVAYIATVQNTLVVEYVPQPGTTLLLSPTATVQNTLVVEYVPNTGTFAGPTAQLLVSENLRIRQGTGAEIIPVALGNTSLKLRIRMGEGGAIFDPATQTRFKFYVKGVEFTKWVAPNSASGDVQLNFTPRARMTLFQVKNRPNAIYNFPTHRTTLALPFTVGNPTMTVVSAATFPSDNFLVKVDNEYFWVYARVGNVLSVTPGYYSSTPASHLAGATVDHQIVSADFVPPMPFFPEVGMPVVIWYYDGDYCDMPHRTNKWVKQFAGQIYEVASSYQSDVTSEVKFDINLSGFDYTLQRRVIKAKYPRLQFPTLNAIMQDIAVHYLTPEGLTWVDAPVDVAMTGDVEFNNITLLEALQNLANLTNYNLRVDNDRNVRIFDLPSAVTAAPFDVREVTVGPQSEIFRDLKVLQSRALYRNQQRISGIFAVQSNTLTLTYNAGVDEATPFFKQWQLNTFVDGSGTNVRAPFLIDTTYDGQVQRIVEIRLNGVPQPFYVVGDPAPASYKWTVMSNNTIQLLYDVLTPSFNWPKAGDVLTVVIEIPSGSPPPDLISDPTEIALRQSIEGFGTGIYEAVEDFSTYTDAAVVLQYAQALLARYNRMGSEITFDTDTVDWDPGQSCMVNLPKLNILTDTLYKVESMSWREEAMTLLRTSLKVSNTIAQRDGIAAFSRLIKRLSNQSKPSTDVAMFNLAASSSPSVANTGIEVGVNVTNAFPVRQKSVSVRDIAVTFKSATAVSGASVKFNLKRNGLLINQYPVEIPVGNLGGTLLTYGGPWLQSNLFEGDLITIDIVQISSNAVTDVSVVLRGFV